MILPLFSGHGSLSTKKLQFTTTSNTILYVFSGSDWCAGCIRLERQVLSDSSFIENMKVNQITIEKIDFPQRKKLTREVSEYNRAIAQKFNFDGAFPSLILFASERERFKLIPYQGELPEHFSKIIISEASQLHE
jgi:thiol-disulfide isomerase/thioredoxin